MVKHTLKILRCEHCKNLKVCLAFFNIMHERVKSQKNVLLHVMILTAVKTWN